jgi:serine/threonine-protein kinase OSR1/STK39
MHPGYKIVIEGIGNQATVKLATDSTTGRLVSIKMFNLPSVGNSLRLQKICQETENLRLLDHKNIVKVFDTCQSPQTYWLVMEFCGKATLHHVLKITQDGKLSEKRNNM